ncbi:unnamed protein product [Caenorhabditis bovis]|uniref:Galectin n=1 Tax=Caenorhabditis bovis TaxID=2654633 RepID=A0A8S1EHF6_9PELO|nr:unnamed protein product [Caenorhabditis bovis]
MAVEYIDSPDCPASYGLCHGILSGDEIIFTGTVKKRNKDFGINFLSGKNVVLHLYFRWTKEKIMKINSKIDIEWGEEIRLKNVLHRNQNFTLSIRVYPKYYKVTINGEHISNVEHRQPYESIQTVFIDGNVKIHKVLFTKFK